jgi:hypothetical protein
MGLSKHQEHGMNGLGIFSLKIILGLVRQILLSSLESVIPDFASKTKYSSYVCPGSIIRHIWTQSGHR